MGCHGCHGLVDAMGGGGKLSLQGPDGALLKFCRGDWRASRRHRSRLPRLTSLPRCHACPRPVSCFEGRPFRRLCFSQPRELVPQTSGLVCPRPSQAIALYRIVELYGITTPGNAHLQPSCNLLQGETFTHGIVLLSNGPAAWNAREQLF